MLSAPEERIGQVVAGRYEVIGVLGEGGMGAVYEARHTFTGRHVALKLPHAFASRSEEAVARMLREARAPSAIGHPGITTVLDAGVDDEGQIYLVFELLHGEDLSRALDREAIEPGRMVAVAVGVLDILAAAHAQGFVHRDIKPENIFLSTEAPEVRLLDFGIARQITPDGASALTRTGAVLGTPAYMSPEQLRGEPVSPRSDLWAVGALIFRGLTGQPPFLETNYNLLVSRILTEDAPRIASLRDDLPAELCAVVDRALRRKPDERFSSAGEMADALRAVGGLGALPPPPADAAAVAPTVASTDADASAAPAADAATVPIRPAAGGPGRRAALGAGALLVASLGTWFAWSVLSSPDPETDTPEDTVWAARVPASQADAPAEQAHGPARSAADASAGVIPDTSPEATTTGEPDSPATGEMVEEGPGPAPPPSAESTRVRASPTSGRAGTPGTQDRTQGSEPGRRARLAACIGSCQSESIVCNRASQGSADAVRRCGGARTTCTQACTLRYAQLDPTEDPQISDTGRRAACRGACMSGYQQCVSIDGPKPECMQQRSRCETICSGS